MQLVGLVILPLGSLMQLEGAISPGGMLGMMVAGAALFGIGYIMMTYR